MKMKKYLIVLLALIITLVSCNIEMLPEGESVNEYIFPYMTFTLSDDGTYYTASIIKGVSLESVFVPAYVAHDGSSIPVKYFDGFRNPEDAKNLKKLVFESNITILNPDVLRSASGIYMIEYEKIESSVNVWANLPSFDNTSEEEFAGWFVLNSGKEVHEGDIITSDSSSITAIWRPHTLTTHKGKEPTCTESGWYEYVTCGTCSYTTYRERAKLDHSLVHHDEVRPTCTESGTRDYYECENCHTFFSDRDGISIISGIELSPLGHSTLHVDRKAPTCTEDGTDEHYECSRCHLLFTDKEATEPVTLEGLVIRAEGHKWERKEYSDEKACTWDECSVCHETDNAAGHTWDEGVVKTEATAAAHGVKVYTCTVCKHTKEEDIPPLGDHNWKDGVTVAPTCTKRGYTTRVCTDCSVSYEYDYKDPEGHKTTLVEAKAATCLEDGNKSYYKCSVCNLLFKDKNGINSTTAEEVRETKTDHKYDADVYEYESGTHWHTCIWCNTKIGETAHSFTIENTSDSRFRKSDATCTSPALYYYSCVCGAYTTEKTFKSGDALGHDTVRHDLKPANCGYPGTKEYWECTRCNRKFQDEACTKEFGNDDELVIPATGEHTLESYQSMGTSGHIAQCAVCHKTYGDTVPHTIDTVNWKDDATSHWHACQYCDYKADNAAHTYEDFGTDTICTVCHRVKDESETTTDGGFDIKPENLEPRGKLTISGGNGSFKATFKLDEGSQMTKIKWYLDDMLLEEETALSCSFNAPEKQTYRIMCVVFNSSLVNSYEQTVEGGGTP